MHAEGLSDQAAQAIAPHGIADRALANGHAEAGDACVIGCAADLEKGIPMAFAPLARAFELGGGAEFVAGPQSVSRRRKNTRQRFSVTASRLRPLARRRFRTWRPFFVAMRARNPCVRLRLILLGW
jgi:hypothetical protein